MELHRLDGMDAAGLDSIDIAEVEYDNIDGLNGSQLEALEALGYAQDPQIAYEIQDENGNVVMYADAEENLYMVDGLGELGFLKKVGKGLKNATKFVGRKVVKPVAKGVSNAARFTGKKILKPAVSRVNRYANPATILLRNGFLASMKLNLFKVAEKLRFGYLSDAEARKRGVNMGEFNKLKKAIDKANKIYELAGGKKENLKNAILKGKGNEDKAVPLSGLEGFGQVTEYADDFESFILESDPALVEEYIDEEVDGLGVVTSSAIAAASAAVGSVAALLSKITGVFDKAKNTKEQAHSLVSISKPSPITSYSPTNVAQPPSQSLTASGGTSTNVQVQPYTSTQTTVPGSTAVALPTTIPKPLQRLSQDQIMISPPQKPTAEGESANADSQSWFRKNKTNLLLGAGVAVAAGGILYAVKQSKSKKSKPMGGIPALSKSQQVLKSGPAMKKSKAASALTDTKKKRTKAKKYLRKRDQEKLSPTVLL